MNLSACNVIWQAAAKSLFRKFPHLDHPGRVSPNDHIAFHVLENARPHPTTDRSLIVTPGPTNASVATQQSDPITIGGRSSGYSFNR